MKVDKLVQIGFGIQSPKGDNCKGIIENNSFSNAPIENS